MVERLFLAVLRGCLRFVIVVFPDHTHLLFLTMKMVISMVISNFHKFMFPAVMYLLNKIYVS